MYNLYQPLPLTKNQKLAYASLLVYMTKANNNHKPQASSFVKKTINRLNISQSDMAKVSCPSTIDDLYKVTSLIQGHKLAVDLLHSLWFAVSLDDVITDAEIDSIRNVAHILNINDDKVLAINHLVQDEIAFLKQTCEVLEADEVRC